MKKNKYTNESIKEYEQEYKMAFYSFKYQLVYNPETK